MLSPGLLRECGESSAGGEGGTKWSDKNRRFSLFPCDETEQDLDQCAQDTNTSKRQSVVLPVLEEMRMSNKDRNQSISKPATKCCIKVHRYTDDPTMAWDMIRSKRPVKLVRPMPLDAPVRTDAVRFVCIADTHSQLTDASAIPSGDVLLVAGDFTTCGLPREIKAFNEFLAKLPHHFKVVIGGNHDLTFDNSFQKNSVADKFLSGKDATLQAALKDAFASAKSVPPRSLLTEAYYLQDSCLTLFGLRIYGSPWTPKFDGWAFNMNRGTALLEKWNKIPEGIDVLITHTPPVGHGDLTRGGVRGGCVELLNSVCKRIRPKYHVFGHIHEGYGCTTDGYTKYINACTCDVHMKPTNAPIIFDIPLPFLLPKGHSKIMYADAKASE